MLPEREILLCDYWRSSAAYRVRIVLALKELGWQALPVNLASGEQYQDAHLHRNPQGLVPVLVTDNGLLNQSLAIIEYLDECHPAPPLLPDTPYARATVRGLAYQVAMEMHPLNNLRVLNYLVKELGQGEVDKLSWYRHWIAEGFTALEKSLSQHSLGQYCYGNSVSLADVCLIPQVYNARRFDCPLGEFPLITDIAAHCESLPAFQSAHPDCQAGKEGDTRAP